MQPPYYLELHVLMCLLQELYGDEIGGAMLNALSRLLTSRLQAIGFTCGMDDLLLTPVAEAGRSQVCVCQTLGYSAAYCRAHKAASVRAEARALTVLTFEWGLVRSIKVSLVSAMSLVSRAAAASLHRSKTLQQLFLPEADSICVECALRRCWARPRLLPLLAQQRWYVQSW